MLCRPWDLYAIMETVCDLRNFPDRRTVVVRPTSSDDGKPTLEFQGPNKKKGLKIRYNNRN